MVVFAENCQSWLDFLPCILGCLTACPAYVSLNAQAARRPLFHLIARRCAADPHCVQHTQF